MSKVYNMTKKSLKLNKKHNGIYYMITTTSKKLEFEESLEKNKKMLMKVTWRQD